MELKKNINGRIGVSTDALKKKSGLWKSVIYTMVRKIARLGYGIHVVSWRLLVLVKTKVTKELTLLPRESRGGCRGAVARTRNNVANFRIRSPFLVGTRSDDRVPSAKWPRKLGVRLVFRSTQVQSLPEPPVLVFTSRFSCVAHN